MALIVQNNDSDMKAPHSIVHLFCFSISLLVGCGPGGAGGLTGLSQYQCESPWYYFNSSSLIGVEVLYEEGASPYVGQTPLAPGKVSMPYWKILEDNLKSLFHGRPTQPQFKVPKDISAMRQFAKQNKNNWSDQELYDLSEKVRNNHCSESQAWFAVIFLNGYYAGEKGDSIQPKVLGVSIGGTSVIAMFKPVIEASTAEQGSLQDKYIEQSTLVHEMGHALGLVNNRLPFAGPNHEDHQHATHCTNPNCVMYWQNSGSQSLSNYLDRFMRTGSTVMFGDECLKDARLYNLQPNT